MDVKVIIGISVLIIISLFAITFASMGINPLHSFEVDTLCAENQSFLYRNGTGWGCGQLNLDEFNITQVTESYNYTYIGINESDPLSHHKYEDIDASGYDVTSYTVHTDNMYANVLNSEKFDLYDGSQTWADYDVGDSTFFNWNDFATYNIKLAGALYEYNAPILLSPYSRAIYDENGNTAITWKSTTETDMHSRDLINVDELKANTIESDYYYNTLGTNFMTVSSSQIYTYLPVSLWQINDAFGNTAVDVDQRYFYDNSGSTVMLDLNSDQYVGVPVDIPITWGSNWASVEGKSTDGGVLDLNAGGITQVEVTDGLIDFQDNNLITTGNITTNASVVFSNNESITAGYTYTNAGNHLVLDGVNDYINFDIPNSYLPRNNSHSVFAWIKNGYETSNMQDIWHVGINADTRNHSLFSLRAGSYNGIIHRYGGTANVEIKPTTSYINDIYTDEWIFVGVVIDTTACTARLYLNDTEIAYKSHAYYCNYDVNPEHSAYAQDIGISMYGGTKSYFNGSMDDIMLFNGTLNSTQISELYNTGKNSGLYNGSSTDLVAHYEFENGDGRDSMNTYNGTFTNGATTEPADVAIDQSIIYFSGGISVTDVYYHSEVNDEDDVLNTFIDGADLLNPDGTVKHEALAECYKVTLRNVTDYTRPATRNYVTYELVNVTKEEEIYVPYSEAYTVTEMQEQEKRIYGDDFTEYETVLIEVPVEVTKYRTRYRAENQNKIVTERQEIVNTEIVYPHTKIIEEGGWSASCRDAKFEQAFHRLGKSMQLVDIENKTMIDADIISAETIYTESKMPIPTYDYASIYLNTDISKKDTHYATINVGNQERLDMEERIVHLEGAMQQIITESCQKYNKYSWCNR